MMEMGRLIPIQKRGKTIAVITFYIGNGDASKYFRPNVWSIVDDEPESGDTCYVDHVLSPNRAVGTGSWQVWIQLIKYIKSKFPHVHLIRWNRFRHGRLRSYKRRIK